MSAHAEPAELPEDVSPVLPRPKHADLGLLVRNAVAIAFVGVAISWWLLRFTDFFPAVGGFLGLGGIFAWIAFFSNLIREERKVEMQNELERRVLLGRATTSYALLVAILGAVWAALHGTVVVIGPGDGGKRAVEIRHGERVIETIEVAPGSTVKASLWSLSGSRNLILKSEGLPDLAVRLRNFRRTSVVIPQSFTAQPILLARPAPDVVEASPKSLVKVQILGSSRKWEEYGSIPSGAYAGESIWIGSSADVRVPSSVEDQWLRQFGATPAFFQWLQPKGVGADRPLREGDRIRVCIFSPENQLREMASGEAVVLPAKQRRFPQEIEVVASPANVTRCGL